jgi:hypothetical protein
MFNALGADSSVRMPDPTLPPVPSLRSAACTLPPFRIDEFDLPQEETCVSHLNLFNSSSSSSSSQGSGPQCSETRV